MLSCSYGEVKNLTNKQEGIMKEHISFERFCHIIDKSGGNATERKGMQDVYDAYKRKRGRVTNEDAILIAEVIMALNPKTEW